jgi:hypothetical protein
MVIGAILDFRRAIQKRIAPFEKNILPAASRMAVAHDDCSAASEVKSKGVLNA